MIVILDRNISDEKIGGILLQLENYGFEVHRSAGKDNIILNVHGVEPNFDIRRIQILDGVTAVHKITEPFRLASRRYKKDTTLIKINGIVIGENEIVVIAGPCAIESEEQIFKLAEIVKNAGAKLLRGGAFKPRTSPYSFQGLGEEGLKYLRSAGNQFNLPVVTEIIEASDFDLIEKYTDVFQLGTRNMQNFPLLKVLGKTQKPVLLKRGISATVEDWLLSAEYILAAGNPNVMLCERGIRTFETSTRNTFDLSAIPVVQQRSHLPVVADPSHATGIRDKVVPMARAAVAAGADALMIEVHHDPINALSDGPQALLPDMFNNLMLQMKEIAKVIGRKI